MTSLLPNPEQTFLSNLGVPLAGGSVYTYVPSTLTPKLTWVDPGQVSANSNPIILDAAGRAIIYGVGSYRMKVFDANSNLIYDQLTSAYALDSAISAAMAPVVGAATTATAWALLGGPGFLSAAISSIQLLTGPTGPNGPLGPTGPTGPVGPASSGSFARAGFTGSGTLTVPATATFALIQIWGAGGGGGTGGGGGGGGYSFIWCLASDFTSTVAINIGTGGAGGGAAGGDGTVTNIGGYIFQNGGLGGYTSPIDGTTPVTGASGYLAAISSGLTVIQIYQVPSQIPVGSLNGIVPLDRFGNEYGSSVGAGSPGQDSNLDGPYPALWGGTGGTAAASGAAPGGGGGNDGGAGGNGQVVVTFF